jgi:hypothetical protein
MRNIVSQLAASTRLAILVVITMTNILMVADRAVAQKEKPAARAPENSVPDHPGFPEKESPPAMIDLATRLTRLLKIECPEAKVALRGDELRVSFRTQKFMVHGRNRAGEFSEKAHEEEGPRLRGFLLQINYHAERPIRALVVPCDVQEPYWTTFVNDFAIGKGKEAGFASATLSYNQGTGAKLLEKLKNSLTADEKPALSAPATRSKKSK